MSVLFIRSAQAYVGGELWRMQIIWVLVGVSSYAVMSLINYHFWMRYAHYLYGLGLLALCMVFFGPEIYGAKRWIDLKIFKIQPAELAKLATLVLGASILARSEIGTLKESMKGIGKVALCFALPMFLIFKQPDLGSTLIFPPMLFSLLYVAKIPSRFFVGTFLLFVLALGVVGFDVYRYYQFKTENPRPDDTVLAYEDTSLLPLKDYQRKRILTFLAPEVVDRGGVGANWNRIQALIAVATGGLGGKGLGDGMQAKLGYLPSAVGHNDFIFAVLAEEAGFVGGLLALSLFAVVIMGCLLVAGRASDRFGAMLATGAAALMMTHVFVNVGMTLGITPITGLPLPFLSYGGSFLVSCCILMGLVQSVYRHRKEFR
ncbi:MAG: rod shape-determining protein RodA [Opitutae bacterium]|nr:rod shape-determining protein RodA [Opitutae bacterium]